MKYPHTIAITRTAETISATGGVPVAGATTTIYSGKCDAQENSRRFDVQSGLVTGKGSVTIFLPRYAVRDNGIATGDDFTITWADGSTKTGRLSETVNLDDGVLGLYG